MTKLLSLSIALGCAVLLISIPLAAIYLLIDIELFSKLAIDNLKLPIQWDTVTNMQWYGLWLLASVSFVVGLAGLYYLRRAFLNFARGELFTRSNSRDLRLFSIFLLIQSIITPAMLSASSVLLSLNHPVGQRLLSLSFGTNEVKAIALAMILWVISDLLIKANELESENKQFI